MIFVSFIFLTSSTILAKEFSLTADSLEPVISVPLTPEERLKLWQYAFEGLAAKNNNLGLEKSDAIYRALDLTDPTFFQDQLDEHSQHALKLMLSESVALFSATDYEALTSPLAKMSQWLIDNKVISKDSPIATRTPDCNCDSSFWDCASGFTCSHGSACVSTAGSTYSGRCVKKGSGIIGIQ